MTGAELVSMQIAVSGAACRGPIVTGACRTLSRDEQTSSNMQWMNDKEFWERASHRLPIL